MTFSQKTVDFTARHQFSAIAGCWALGIAGAFGVIMRNPYVAREKKERMNGLTNLKISKYVTKGMVRVLIIETMEA